MPLVHDDDRLTELINRTQHSKHIVVDTETTGVDFKHDVICGYVLTFGPSMDDSFYWPVGHAEGNYYNDMAEEHMIELLSMPNKRLVFHNAAFDLSMLHGKGWERGPEIEDTMIGRYLVDEQKPQSLEACCKDFKVQAKKSSALYHHIARTLGGNIKPDKKSMENFWLMPGDDLVVVDYATGDGVSTWQLWDAIQPEIDKEYLRGRSLRRVYDMEMSLIPVLHDMRMRGIKVDEERLANVIGILEGDRDKALKEIGDINVRSAQQIQAYMERHGITGGWPETETGGPSFPEAWLVQTEPGQKIVNARKRRTLLETFLYKLRDTFLHKGRVHPEFHQSRDEDFGTITGRLSSTAPNFQAQPGKRQDDLGKLVRSIYLPDNKLQWVESDYHSAEVRIATHYSKAQTWLRGFSEGGDPHGATAKKLNVPRPTAKVINLGIIMGMGARGISKQLGVNRAEAKTLLKNFYANVPELKVAQDNISADYARLGFVSTLLHRRLHLPGGDRDKAFTGINRLTQGGNADITKAALVRMDKISQGTSADLLLTVHDSIGFQCEDEQTAEMLVTAMEDTDEIPISLPMPCEWGNGSNWGDATFNEAGWI
jgi:DNA polymerase-1